MAQFHHFQEDVSGIALPEKFTYPFYYEPHPLAIIAAGELQQYLENQQDFHHNFGLDNPEDPTAKGKMFGVLVVQNPKGELGYLAAFSGSFSDKNFPSTFVPPLFNIYLKHGFFRKGENELIAINRQIEALEADPLFIRLKAQVNEKKRLLEEEYLREKARIKKAKKVRKASRQQAEKSMSPEALATFKKQQEKESFVDRYFVKNLSDFRKGELLPYQQKLEAFTQQIATLKAARKSKSAQLQQQIFDQYQFLNQQKEVKALTEIFPLTADQQPPGGAGECAAPRLLQYAFAHDLRPVCMAEFWWGVSPKTEIRRHKAFYPACQGRCKPILAHMLAGIEMDENPILQRLEKQQEPEIIFEDEALIVLNKAPGVLSVPGKEVTDSVYTRMLARYPEATGPMIVHRLDMSTSGILVLTKTKEAHKILQKQFLERKVKKRYVALLEGLVKQDEGYIDLPLRVDLDDRPRQMVCYEHGKPARTQWKVVERKEGKTRVHFYPITGRTHQLRVHAAHPLGLNSPIVGDDLYGTKADRLHLHAAFIQFVHPVSGERMRFSVREGF